MSNASRCSAPDCPNNVVIRGFCLQHQGLVGMVPTNSNNSNTSSSIPIPSAPPKPFRFQSQSGASTPTTPSNIPAPPAMPPPLNPMNNNNNGNNNNPPIPAFTPALIINPPSHNSPPLNSLGPMPSMPPPPLPNSRAGSLLPSSSSPPLPNPSSSISSPPSSLSPFPSKNSLNAPGAPQTYSLGTVPPRPPLPAFLEEQEGIPSSSNGYHDYNNNNHIPGPSPPPNPPNDSPLQGGYSKPLPVPMPGTMSVMSLHSNKASWDRNSNKYPSPIPGPTPPPGAPPSPASFSMAGPGRFGPVPPTSASFPATPPPSFSSPPPLPNGIPGPSSSSTLPASFAPISNNNGNNLSPVMASLTHLVDEVGMQTDAGLYIAKRIGNVLKKICAAEEEFGRIIQKIVDYESTKAGKIAKDRILSGAQAWRDAQSILREWGQHHINTSQKVMLECTVPVLEFYGAGMARRKEVELEEKKLSKEMVVQQVQVNNDLSACQRLLIQANALQRKETGEDFSSSSSSASSAYSVSDIPSSPTYDDPPVRDSSVSATSKASAFLSKMTKKVAKGLQEFTLLSPDQLREKIYQAANKYIRTIDQGNQYQSSYFNQDLPRILNVLEGLERSRLFISSSSLHQWMGIIRENNPALRQYLEKIPIALKPLDVDYEIKTVVEGWIHVFGTAPHINPFSYQLPCQLHDIQAGRYAGSPNSVFHTSLQHCMKLQEKGFPDLKVPRIVHCLCHRLIQYNDCYHEGLFRVSPMKSELDELRKKIDKGEYHLIDQSSSPHCVAAMLKEWLRLLSEPLIGDKYYNQAVELGKQEFNKGGEDGPSGPTSYPENRPMLDFFNTLDVTPKFILKYLGDMWMRVLNPANQLTNKMSIEALSIVFAPCFLRTTATDPNIVLAAVKFETKFTAGLMKQVMRMVITMGI